MMRSPENTTDLKQMEDKMDRLKGKVILISGGARGQGAAEARLFAAEGARLVIGDVLEPECRQLASELGNAAAFVRQDVMQERDWETAVNAAEKLGGLHGLVNNAGIYQPRTLMETDTELFERHTRVNQLGCFLGMKTVVPLMEQSGGGSIVNISSVAGLRGFWMALISERREDRARADGVHTNALRRVVGGERPRQARDRGLGGIVLQVAAACDDG